MKARPASLQKPNYFLQQFRESVQLMIENFGRFVSSHFHGDVCEIHLDQLSIQERPDETEVLDSLSLHSNAELDPPRGSLAIEQIRMSDGFMFNKRTS